MSPRRVCRQACSSTPITATPSRRCGSLINIRRPSSSTALFAVFQVTASASATRATDRCCTTIACSAQASARRDSFARGCAARLMSRRHTCRHGSQPKRLIVTTRLVGRCPNGSCANERVTLSRGVPWPPQRRHHRSNSPGTGRQASTARPGSRRCAITSRPSSSRRQNAARSGRTKVASRMSRSSGSGV